MTDVSTTKRGSMSGSEEFADFLTVVRKKISQMERARIFLRNKGICHICGGKIRPAIEAWDVSHEIPIAAGGEDTDENRRAAHRKCHRKRTSYTDAPRIAKTKRQMMKNIGIKRTKKPMPFSKGSKFKKKLNGEIVLR